MVDMSVTLIHHWLIRLLEKAFMICEVVVEMTTNRDVRFPVTYKIRRFL